MMVREPVPGAVKTRLIPALGATAAAELYRAFLGDLCARLAPAVPLALAVAAPAPANGYVATLARRHRLPMLPQGDGDLGARMRRVATTVLASVPRVVLLGSDAPTLPVAHVVGALHALTRARIVIGPSIDGGYHLLGMRAPLADVFTRMPWGTERVLGRTLARLARARVAAVTLPCWYDVDTAADVDLLTRHLATLAVVGETSCPRTRRTLRRIRRAGVLPVTSARRVASLAAVAPRRAHRRSDAS